jgi:hypothetical protein
VTCPKPGIYKGVDFDEYASWDAANASTLKLFERSAAHARVAIENPRSTKYLDFGWAFHLAVLEPERFEEEVAVLPPLDKRTRAGKATWAAFTLEHPHAFSVSQEEMDAILSMRDKVLGHPTAHELFQEGASEVSVVWIDPELGVPCKARVDRIGRIGNSSVIADLKSADNASSRAFSRACWNLHYHVAAAHYLSGLNAVAPVPEGNNPRRFVWVAVESKPPFELKVYEPDDGILEIGERQRTKWLAALKECRETGIWPGYDPGVDYVFAPAWALKSWEE